MYGIGAYFFEIGHQEVLLVFFLIRISNWNPRMKHIGHKPKESEVESEGEYSTSSQASNSSHSHLNGHTSNGMY